LLLGLGTAAALFDRDAIRGPAGRGELFIETDREAQVILKRDGRLVRILDVDESRAFDLAAGEYEAEAVEVPDRGRLRVGPFLVPRGGREVVRLRFQPSYPPVTFPLTLSGHAAPVWGVAFSPDGKTLASVSRRNAKLWDLTTGKEAATLEDGSAAFMSVAFSPDGKTVSGGGLYSFVRTWDSKTGKLLRERHVWGEVRGVAYTANDRLASASVLWSGPNGNVVRGDLQIWDPATGRDKVTFETEPGIGQLCVACSPDGTVLAAASGRYDSKKQRVVSAQVKVWDASSGKAVATLGGYTDAIGNVAFSPDGKRLAVASWDNSLDVWEVASRRKLFSCRGHAGGVFAVCFSRDGKRLASGGRDCTVRVWDAATGSERRCLRGHASGVPGVAFSPDGTRLASAGQEGTVRVWDVHLAE
jgi:WD40 repeat protein